MGRKKKQGTCLIHWGIKSTFLWRRIRFDTVPEGLARMKRERERDRTPADRVRRLLTCLPCRPSWGAERALRLPVAGPVAAAAARELALVAEARALTGAVLRVTTAVNLWAHRRQSRLRGASAGTTLASQDA